MLANILQIFVYLNIINYKVYLHFCSKFSNPKFSRLPDLTVWTRSKAKQNAKVRYCVPTKSTRSAYFIFSPTVTSHIQLPSKQLTEFKRVQRCCRVYSNLHPGKRHQSCHRIFTGSLLMSRPVYRCRKSL